MIPKFKAFLKDTNQVLDVEIIFFELCIVKLTNDEFYQFEDIILMQSTGLHDNTKFEDLSEEEQEEWLESGKTPDEWQGREIFEGDIVNINTTFRNPMTGSGTLTLNKNFEVIFVNGMFTIEGSSMGIGKDLKYLTVVGDVYKNHELLEDVWNS